MRTQEIFRAAKYVVFVSRGLIFSGLIFASSPARSEDIKISMGRAFEAFRSLQPYLVEETRFEDRKNEQAVLELITSLRDNFHDLSAFPTRFQSQPGFASNVAIVSELLDDVTTRFREGHKSYAAWRLRGISKNCISCHATYNVELAFHEKVEPNLDGVDNIRKAEFFLATRQLDKAEKYLQDALKDDPASFQTINVLRRILTLHVRMKADPAAALAKIEELTKELKLPQQDRQEVQHWIISLRAWKDTKSHPKNLADVQTIIKRSLSLGDELDDHVDSVGLLRATDALHKLLVDPSFPTADRPEALYLLGLSYSKLPLYFIDELPELYLRQSIDSSPGTKTAQKAYRLYKDLVETGFTGSSGTSLPGDIKSKLMELHDKAYGIPPANGKV